MKKMANESQNTEVTGLVAKISRKKKWLIVGGIILFVAVLAGGGYWWYRAHQHKPLTPTQQAAENTLPGLKSYTAQEEQQHVPNDIRAGTMANLAIAEAVAGKCSDAKRDLAQAKKIAPASSAAEMNAAQKQVNNYCH
jgi:type VI protein secretion system component VasK